MPLRATTDKPLLRALCGQPQTPPPVWLMRQAGRYLPEYRKLRERAGSFLNLCYTPDLAAEVTLQPVRRYAMDGAILFSDILVIPDALGVEVSFRAGDGPRLSPIKTVEDIAKLGIDGLDAHLAPVYETVERVSAALPDGVALIGFAGAPWTVATYMVEGGSSKDFALAKRWALCEPEEFQVLVDLLVEATAAYMIEQVNRGAEVLQIFDSWAGALPEAGFRRWSIAPTRDLVGRIKAVHPDVPIIGFPRGAGVLLRCYAEETSVDAVSLDSNMPTKWAVNELQASRAIQGNLDPIYLYGGGSAMIAEIHAILDAFAGRPFVFNLGHGVVPGTPPENVAQLVETVRAWRG